MAVSFRWCSFRAQPKRSIVRSVEHVVNNFLRMPPKKRTVTQDAAAAENGVSTGDAPRVKLARAAKQAVEAKPKGKAADQPNEPKKAKKPVKEPVPKKNAKPKPEPAARRIPAAVEEAEDEAVAAKPKKGKQTKPKAAPQPKKGRKKVEEAVAEDESQPKKAKAPLQNKATTDYSNQEFSCAAKNANGKAPNLKISSWNVDGLRAWVKKNGLEFVSKEDPDILCLQETKCSEEKLPEEAKNFENYSMYWCSGEKEGYAGVALYSKTEPISVKYGLDVEDFDDEGRCITAEYNGFYLVNVYVPNAGRKLVTLPKRLTWNEAFKKFIKGLDQSKPVIVCGDMNVAHNEIDLANPATNKKNAGFTAEEREGMTEFLSEGFVDSYRELYPDKKDVYTFWSYMNNARAKNVGWRLDYFIVSQRFMDNICDNTVRSEVFGSDHCPITLFLNV